MAQKFTKQTDIEHDFLCVETKYKSQTQIFGTHMQSNAKLNSYFAIFSKKLNTKLNSYFAIFYEKSNTKLKIQ